MDSKEECPHYGGLKETFHKCAAEGSESGAEPGWQASQAEEEAAADDCDDEELMCEHCQGDGGDPHCDGILPCPECDGQGYKWWL